MEPIPLNPQSDPKIQTNVINANFKQVSDKLRRLSSGADVVAVDIAKIVNPYIFKAYVAVNQTVNNYSLTQVVFGGESFDLNNNFATNAYTVPVTGYYLIQVLVIVYDTAGKMVAVNVQLKLDAAIACQDLSGPYPSAEENGEYTASFTHLMAATAGQVMTVHVIASTSDTGTFEVIGGFFSGMLVAT